MTGLRRHRRVAEIPESPYCAYGAGALREGRSNDSFGLLIFGPVGNGHLRTRLAAAGLRSRVSGRRRCGGL
jgi:hypothetical protein